MKTTNTKITKRSSNARGVANFGWLNSRHTFSFGEYYDPTHMGFRSLRVINEDQVAPSKGFGTHPHRNMEIFSYVVSGQLEHKDNMGNGRVLHAGDFQYMSAGSGVLHSEYNPSAKDESHFLQIWIQPQHAGGEPRYEEKSLDPTQDTGLQLLASPDGKENSIAIRQDAEIYFGRFGQESAVTVPTSESFPYTWIQLIEGELELAGESFQAGDGIAIEGDLPEITSKENDTSFLFFRLT